MPEPDVARVLLPITPQKEDPISETVKPPRPDVLEPPPLPVPIQSTIDLQEGPVLIPITSTAAPVFDGTTLPTGGASILANREIQMLSQAIPVYPERARSAGREGACDVSIDVDPRGNPFNIVAACTHSMFHQEAIRAVENVRFIPAIRDGQAVTSRGVLIPIEFALED